MKIAFITAGAAGMYCGSCMRDNALVTALIAAGHEALLIPTYTPIRTDELDVSQGKVFYGGINVYLQDKSWLFRHTPRFFDWLLNRPWLLRWVSRKARSIDYADLAGLTVSMLRGADGRQAKELEKLVEFLRDEVKPDVVVLTNALLSGLVPTVKKALGVPVFATLQGDDIFLNALPVKARAECLAAIRRNDASVTGYLATCHAYADDMATYFGVARSKIQVVYPGINLAGHGGPAPAAERPPAVGYFARICPEKGFHNAVSAFLHLRHDLRVPGVKLKAAGWLGANDETFFAEQVARLTAAGLADDFEHLGSPDHVGKVAFLQSIDVLTVPTDYHEPKGLPVLEAWANGVPVVQPRHGSFPELLAATGGGLLTTPGDAADLAQKLQALLADADHRRRLGEAGRAGVHAHFTADRMAAATVEALAKHLPAA